MAADVTVAPTLGHAVLLTQGGVGASPGYDAIDLRRMVQAANGGQEGVYDATGWDVVENSGGANMTVQVAANVGLARVNGESVTHQGPYVVAPHSAVITLDVATAHSTNPRVDMVILHVRDNTHDALGANDARVRILSGTATSGATLDNLNGQASLPSNAVRLADVLVPAVDTTISNAQIRDRRPWARGILWTVERTAGNLVMTSAYTTISDASFTTRLECSGAPMMIRFAADVVAPAGGPRAAGLRLQVDGATYHTTSASLAIAQRGPLTMNIPYTPASGSHVFSWQWSDSTADVTIFADATNRMSAYIAELVRQNASNT